jgi:hypothetical protein
MDFGWKMNLKREEQVLLFEVEKGIHNPDCACLDSLAEKGFIQRKEGAFVISSKGRLEWRAARAEDSFLDMMLGVV